MAKKLEDFAHPAYIQALPDYRKIRDCYRGERHVKAARTVYLPKLGGQSEDDYLNYLTRALFFPITGKTCTTLTGLATMRAPKVEYPDTMSAYFSDTDNNFQFTEAYVGALSEVILMGRYGMLIDAPSQGGQPAVVPYIAENIVNWGTDREGRFTFVLLREVELQPGEQKFQLTNVVRYRHCFVNAAGVYQQEVLDDDLEPIGPVVTPTFSGTTLDQVPFTVIGSTGVHPNVDSPPMLDITTVNLSHYLTSADLEWGRHIVGLPTPVVSGVDASTSLKIGGTSAWVLPPAEAKAYYLEFLGEGLKSLETAMTDKIGLMASISARMIDNSTRGSEAAETVRLRYMSESASLVHIIGSVEAGFNRVYNVLATLGRHSGQVKILFSREILGAHIKFSDLEILLKAYLSRALSKESFLYNLRRLDAADPTRTDDQELSAIKEPPITANPAPVTP